MARTAMSDVLGILRAGAAGLSLREQSFGRLGLRRVVHWSSRHGGSMLKSRAVSVIMVLDEACAPQHVRVSSIL